VKRLASWEELARAVEIELGEIDLPRAHIERNLAAARRAFETAPEAGLPAPAASTPPSEPIVIPRLPARAAAPSIATGQTSLLRSTEGWRTFRSVIDLAGCTRCFYCFALCPEGAIRLDGEGYPHVDYQCPARRPARLRGPKLFVALSSCPPGWGIEPEESVAIARLAVESGVWPLKEWQGNGVVHTPFPQKRKPVEDYLLGGNGTRSRHGTRRSEAGHQPLESESRTVARRPGRGGQIVERRGGCGGQ
jgi:Pyruvate/2-oxoacid:ferredoxin oxidoreductase delta subunit